ERQLGEPWYRVYYDQRERVIVFPNLEPGDVVELRYRVDDVAYRNQFADYFGDIHFFQSFSPAERADYILITPKGRHFYFNRPVLAGLRYQREIENDLVIHRWNAHGVPALRREEGMPGMTEVAPYLHVSTYQTWEEVGRWYWGLIRDQLHADEELKRIVR